MPEPTSVNSQITDAVTQANVKVLGEAPAMAVGSLYQSLAHATGIAFQNAVAAQQQQNIEAQAAANQGVIQIYSIDTLAAASASTSSPDALLASAQKAQATLKSVALAPASSIDEQVEDALKLADEVVLGRAADVAYSVRACADALSAALQTLSRTLHVDRMHTLQMAATAECLEAMLRNPEKTADYEAVLKAIRHLD